MQPFVGNTRANTTFKNRPFQMLQTTQTQDIHATGLRHTLISFNIKRLRLAAQLNAYANRWCEGRMGPGMDATHQTLLKECRDALGPAALVAAVTPGGFSGALGGYANLQRIAFSSSSSSGHSGYLAGRSASPSLAPSSPLSESLANGLHDDEDRQLGASDNYSEAAAKRGTDGGDVSGQLNTQSLFGRQNGLLTIPMLSEPSDRKTSTLSYGPKHAHIASSSSESKEETLESSTALGTGASSRTIGIGTSAIPQPPSILAVERSVNNKLKRARNSAEDCEEDAERQGVNNRTRKRKRSAASISGQPPTPISLPVERKNLKRARDSVEDDEDEGRRPSIRVKFNETSDMGRMPLSVFGTISESRRTQIQAQTQARIQKRAEKTTARAPLLRLGHAKSGSMISRLRRDSFGEIPSNRLSESTVSTPVSIPSRRSVRLQKKSGKDGQS